MKIDAPLFESLVGQYQQRVDAALDRWLPPADVNPMRLHQAMRYAVLAPGKRVRPVLVYATATALGIDLDRVDGAACAVEIIHAYSLIHDDLPAMDDDDLRRGRPTCHREFDEATAILAGDALQALAFYIISHDPEMTTDASARLQMIENLSLFSGSRGMAGGQAIDLAAVGKSLNIAELETMHIHKTGALIRTCVQLAALSTDNLGKTQFQALDSYAKCIGLSFQVQDDILDVTGDTSTLGKTLELHHNALQTLSIFGEEADILRYISAWFVERRN
jgi:farnesyl diphosphate synthase